LKILGVDPGSWNTGWGLLQGPDPAPRLIDCGVIRLQRGQALALRLSRLQLELTQVVSRLGPDCAAVESPFHGASARSSLQLAHARGVVLAVLAGAGIDVAEYTPATVKKSVTGNGRADKRQVAEMVGRILGQALEREREDLTDALAVSICHLSHLGFDRALRRSETGARRS